MQKRVLRIVYLVLAFLCIVSLLAVSGVLARYSATVQSNQEQATPEEFYFECNFEQGGLYLFPAGENFEFVVKNHDPFGRYSASTVEYSVTFDGEMIVSGQLEKGSANSQSVILDKSKLILGETHEVVVTSTKPFEKTISFDIFVVQDKVESFYTMKDHGNWVQLDLYIGSTVPASLTIEYGDLAPDNTHPLMRTWKTADQRITLTNTELHPYTHYSLIFFGTQNVKDVDDKTALPQLITLE